VSKPKPSANRTNNGSGVSSKDFLEDLLKTLEGLTEIEVLVGFPEETDERKPDPDDPKKPQPVNAVIAYIQDNGAPEKNIPPRPFMIPAMQNCRARVTKALFVGALRALNKPKDKSLVVKTFMAAGLVAQNALRAKINEGIPPPLAESTLQQRARRGRKGAKKELANRAAGLGASTALAKPLIDTGQLRNAATFVLRKRSQRKK